ncbi:MAG: threonine synthase [Chloroflexi bacterium B3_Chlor]|nr:MAG: threonine synthase [Chloroflexi bacterium B3_Chlor]
MHRHLDSALVGLKCTACGADFSADELINVCLNCGKVLFATYDLERVTSTLHKEDLPLRERTLWRYWELLPVATSAVSLGEGMTPIFRAERLGAQLGCPRLFIKEEGINPTGTFKSRGLSVAVSRAKELGAEILAMPSAGNAGAALAAYGAKAGLETWVFMPAGAPESNKVQCQAHGANLVLVEGLIDAAGRESQKEGEKRGWFDVSTLKEPYRVEGKKTMGFEIAEQLSWRLPEVIIYPTGGGTGLIGMWKGFDELERLGWIGTERPRMIAVQSTACAPIVRAFEEGATRAEPWAAAHTIAPGLNVPAPFADYLILRVIRESGGVAVSVSDQEILSSIRDLARDEGIFACPEGAATLAGLRTLLAARIISGSESVLLLNTGSGLIYPGILKGIGTAGDSITEE